MSRHMTTMMLRVDIDECLSPRVNARAHLGCAVSLEPRVFSEATAAADAAFNRDTDVCQLIHV